MPKAFVVEGGYGEKAMIVPLNIVCWPILFGPLFTRSINIYVTDKKTGIPKSNIGVYLFLKGCDKPVAWGKTDGFGSIIFDVNVNTEYEIFVAGSKTRGTVKVSDRDGYIDVEIVV